MSSTEKIKGALDFEHNRGKYGIIGAIVSAALALSQLPQEQLDRVLQFWEIAGAELVSVGIALIILSAIQSVARVYLAEQKARTTIEVQINANLEKLSDQFKALLDHTLDNKISLDRMVTGLEDKISDVRTDIAGVHKTIEKRQEYRLCEAERYNTTGASK